MCEDCLESLPRVGHPCSCCGLPNASRAEVCASCLLKPPRWHNMIAPLIYRAETRRLIHDLKFNEQLYVANALLQHLAHCYRDHPVEVLMPVPLHPTRLLERGFNQSAEIAAILSRHLHIPLDRHSLKRIKATDSQSGLSLNKRRKNLLKAFQYDPQEPYRSVAIIDDVITSGSTMTEICKQLQKAGVKHMEVWSLARALKQD